MMLLKTADERIAEGDGFQITTLPTIRGARTRFTANAVKLKGDMA
jgi:hypothetical protein